MSIKGNKPEKRDKPRYGESAIIFSINPVENKDKEINLDKKISQEK